MAYEPYERLVAPARPSAKLRRLAGGCVAIVMIFLLLSLFYASIQGELLPREVSLELSDDLQTGTTPLAALINLFFFLFLIIALRVALWLFHDRTLRSLIGPWGKTITQFRKVVLALAPIYLVVMLLPAPEGFQPSLHMALGDWLFLLPVALLGLLIQTSAEELVFRGYLQSQLAAQFSSPLVWIGLPSLLFALLHYDTMLAGDFAGLIVIWAGVFALITADLTARSGTLGPAIAVHLGNNFGAILLAAPDGNFDGLALYTFPFSLADADALIVWMPVELMLLLCSWLAARVALRC